ncbi:MAG TPA: hypothetical protein VIX87_02975 [Steroidobacteraceae bacterium]
MALMSATPSFDCRLARGALYAVLLVGLATGCQTVTTAPTDTHLAGTWNLNKAVSDDPDARIAAALHTAETKLRARMTRAGYGPDNAGGRGGGGHGSEGGSSGGGGGSGGIGGGGSGDSGGDSGGADNPDYSFDIPEGINGSPGRIGPDFRGLRQRLREELAVPTTLTLDVQGDLVAITDDALPSRDYLLGERVSRIDDYGTAIVTAGWDHESFELAEKYTSHASHSKTYAVDPGTGLLTLTQQLNDPTVGRILVHSVYRRTGAGGG